MRRPIFILLSFVVACGPSVPVASDGTTSGADDDDGSLGPGSTSDPDPSTTDATIATSTSSSADGSSSNGGDASTSVDGDDGGFLDIDGGGSSIECDIWIDDCPPGQKCMPWANDGGNSWNATKCSPLAEDPNEVGDPCTVEGSGVSGLDDCEARSMCWDVDPETNEGECVAFCNGSEASPTCPNPCDNCAVHNDGVLVLCLPSCDPLVQDCGEGEVCFPTFDDESFACYPQNQSFAAAGDPCEFENVCDPGLFCAAPDLVPNCAGPIGCCTAFCVPNTADPCPEILEGVECIPWFEEGETPPCFAQLIGACILPA